MFDIGLFELIVIFVIALLVVGPEDLPKLVRKVGYYIGQAKGMINSARSTLDDQINDLELKQMIAKRDEEIQDLKKTLTEINPIDDIKKEMNELIDGEPASTVEPKKLDADTSS